MKEIPFKKEITVTNSIIVSRGDENIGTFKLMDNELYFLDWFSKEWEEYDYSFNILTKKEIKYVLKHLRAYFYNTLIEGEK